MAEGRPFAPGLRAGRMRLFLAAAGILLFLAAAGALALEAGRVHLERRLSGLIHLPVRIQRLRFSPRELTLHRISAGKGGLPLTVESLTIKGPLWSFFIGRPDWRRLDSITLSGLAVRLKGDLLEGEGRLFVSGKEGPGRRGEGWLALKHPAFQGRLEISGPVERPVLLGWAEDSRGNRRRFAAQWEPDGASLRLVRMEMSGGWSASGRFSKGRAVLWVRPPDQVPEGLTVTWEKVSPEAVGFSARFLADRALLNGSLGLASPHRLDLTLDLKEAAVAEIASWLLPPNRLPRLAGSVSGQVALTGPLKRMESRGELFGSRGQFNREAIERMSLRFQGSGPILRIQNSQLVKQEGVLLMEGTLDLRRLGQPDFFSQVRLLPVEKAVQVGGWRVRPTASPGLEMERKAPGNRMEVGFSYEMDSQVQTEPVGREKVHLDYPISSRERVNLRLNRQEEFVGLERRKQF